MAYRSAGGVRTRSIRCAGSGQGQIQVNDRTALPRRRGAAPVDELGRDVTDDVRTVMAGLPLDPAHQRADRHAAQAVRSALDEREGEREGPGELVRVAPDDRQVARR